MTEFDAYLDARWGDGPFGYVSLDDRRKCDIRLRCMWQAITLITGSKVDPPLTSEVHSPRALPAVLRVADQRRLVWDAGLGTMLDALAFPMPYPQPRPVVEAMLRRITAVRYLLAGWPEEATNQVRHAEQLLKVTPIDRHYQIHADAESQFEVWLLTEMQERFALGHELAHHLHSADPETFERFASRVHNMAEAMLVMGQPKKSALSTNLDDYDMQKIARNRDLDPYAWYIWNRESDTTQRIRTSWSSRVQGAIAALNSSASTREEIICDTISSLAVGLDAHLRQGGWTAIMGAACSRLALANLGVILGIDEWIAGNQATAERYPVDVTARGECLDLILSWMLPTVLCDHSTSALKEEDIFEAMLLVSEMHEGRIGHALTALGRAPVSSDGELLTADQILATAGFLFLRPSPDWRSASNAARGAGAGANETGWIDVRDGLRRRSPLRW